MLLICSLLEIWDTVSSLVHLLELIANKSSLAIKYVG